MKQRFQFGKLLIALGICAAMVLPCAAQSRKDSKPPQQPRQERRQAPERRAQAGRPSNDRPRSSMAPDRMPPREQTPRRQTESMGMIGGGGNRPPNARSESGLPPGFATCIRRSIPASADHTHGFRLSPGRLLSRRHPIWRHTAARPVVARPSSLRSSLRRLSALLSRLLRRLAVFTTLRRAREYHRSADPQCDQQLAELESLFHFTLHLRILLLPAVIRLHRRRQFRQHVKARKHVQILQ